MYGSIPIATTSSLQKLAIGDDGTALPAQVVADRSSRLPPHEGRVRSSNQHHVTNGDAPVPLGFKADCSMGREPASRPGSKQEGWA